MPSLHGVKNHCQHQSESEKKRQKKNADSINRRNADSRLVLNTLNRRPFQSFRLQTDHHPADTSSDSRDGLLEGAEQNTEDDGMMTTKVWKAGIQSRGQSEEIRLDEASLLTQSCLRRSAQPTNLILPTVFNINGSNHAEDFRSALKTPKRQANGLIVLISSAKSEGSSCFVIWGGKIIHSLGQKRSFGKRTTELSVFSYCSISRASRKERGPTKQSRQHEKIHSRAGGYPQGISFKEAAWLRQKFLNALRKRDAAKKELKEIFHTLNPYEEGHINYSKDFLQAQWEKQTQRESQRAEDDELRMKQLAEFFRNEEVLDKTKCVEDWHDIVTIFENHEVKQQELAVLLGRDYQELLGATGERHPIMGSQTVGTKIQQRILKAITRRKSPVDKAIKEFNKRRSTYLAAYEPTRLKLPENKELGYKAFLKMDLNDPFWNDGFFFHSRHPWAVDYTSAAVSWQFNLTDTLLRLSPEQIDYNNPENRLAAIPILLPITIKLGVMRYELQTCLKNHEQLMSVWISDIDWLWESTRNQHTKSTHPWFESVSFLRGCRYHNTLNGIDDAMEQLNFAEGQANEPDVESSDEENSEGGEGRFSILYVFILFFKSL
ncbi:hypothetical protein KEM48_008421 [Puccinia striiformis f. sp. tritici PST-130]|nr:hypothetical protein KEM48_008421 [Puccinia striiformis f. sp. tritici PST-130]